METSESISGLELARSYYLAFGKKMLEDFFPSYMNRIACGLAGEGSECLGFDDVFSRDHDFGPGFCLWLTDEDDAEIGGALRKAYDELPGEFAGYRARKSESFGEQRLSAMKISSFYGKFTGLPGAPETLDQWRRIPEHFLSAAVSGAVFTDPLGRFTEIRTILLAFYPEDVRLKKIAARAALMSQAGQYNYPRCEKRNEKIAAMWALAEFIKAACSMVYLLNRKYMPYYKWAHRGMRDLDSAAGVYGLIFDLYRDGIQASERQRTIEKICDVVLNELKNQGLTNGTGDFLLDHCEKIIGGIKDAKLRNTHIMAE
jgi:hypothetical protein